MSDSDLHSHQTVLSESAIKSGSLTTVEIILCVYVCIICV